VHARIAVHNLQALQHRAGGRTKMSLNFCSSLTFSRSSVTFEHVLSGWCFSAIFWYAFLSCGSVAIHRWSSSPSKAYRSFFFSFFLAFLFSFLCFHCTLKHRAADQHLPDACIGAVLCCFAQASAQVLPPLQFH
jgi:hypothetical protein